MVLLKSMSDYKGSKVWCNSPKNHQNVLVTSTGLPVENPILGHNILGHFCLISGHFSDILGHIGGDKWYWGASLGSELHHFYETTLWQSIYWHDLDIA